MTGTSCKAGSTSTCLFAGRVSVDADSGSSSVFELPSFITTLLLILSSAERTVSSNVGFEILFERSDLKNSLLLDIDNFERVDGTSGAR